MKKKMIMSIGICAILIINAGCNATQRKDSQPTPSISTNEKVTNTPTSQISEEFMESAVIKNVEFGEGTIEAEVEFNKKEDSNMEESKCEVSVDKAYITDGQVTTKLTPTSKTFTIDLVSNPTYLIILKRAGDEIEVNEKPGEKILILQLSMEQENNTYWYSTAIQYTLDE